MYILNLKYCCKWIFIKETSEHIYSYIFLLLSHYFLVPIFSPLFLLYQIQSSSSFRSISFTLPSSSSFSFFFFLFSFIPLFLSRLPQPPLPHCHHCTSHHHCCDLLTCCLPPPFSNFLFWIILLILIFV